MPRSDLEILYMLFIYRPQWTAAVRARDWKSYLVEKPKIKMRKNFLARYVSYWILAPIRMLATRLVKAEEIG